MINLDLSDGRGISIDEPLDVHDFVDRVVQSSERSRVMRYADPYGTLWLNQVQMEELRLDWGDAEALAASSQDRKAWEDVASLIERCATEPHLFIRLLGD